MSNNARVVAGGEIGSAQYFQALAARAAPDVRMNPVLLKPERDTHSQVVVLGQVTQRADAPCPGASAAPAVWPQHREALDALRAENDVRRDRRRGLAGRDQPADSDFVNMRMARHARRALPAGDRHRPRRRLRAPVRHLGAAGRGRARADPRLRAEQVPRRRGAAGAGPAAAASSSPACRRSRRCRCGGSTACPRKTACSTMRRRRARRRARAIAVVAYPRISNLDEFQPLANVPGVRLRWARTPGRAGAAPTGSCCPAPSTPAATWPGCARRAWTARSRAMRQRGGAGAGHLRRPADAGRGAGRPARHRRQRAGPRPAAAGDGCSSADKTVRARRRASASSRAPGRRCRAWR